MLVGRDDSLYRRTVKALPAADDLLVRRIARLLGPGGDAVLQWFRRAPLDGGLAAEVVDDAGTVVANGGDASLSGLLAATSWYAVHALGLAV